MKTDAYSILYRFTQTEMTTLKSLKAPGPLVIFVTAATFALCGEKC